MPMIREKNDPTACRRTWLTTHVWHSPEAPFTQNALLCWQRCDVGSGIGKHARRWEWTSFNLSAAYFRMPFYAWDTARDASTTVKHVQAYIEKTMEKQRKRIKNLWLLLYVWYFMFASWWQAESCCCFYRTFIVNSLLVLYLQSFWIWITGTFWTYNMQKTRLYNM